MRKPALELGRVSIPDFVFFRISSGGLSRCRPFGHLQYTVQALTLSTSSAWTTTRKESPTTGTTYPVCRGNCRAHAAVPFENKGETTSHMSASRPDLPQNLRLPGEPKRCYRIKDITFCGKSGRSASHDMWELVQRRIPPAADDGFNDGFQPPPPQPRGCAGLRSPAFHPRFVPFSASPLCLPPAADYGFLFRKWQQPRQSSAPATRLSKSAADCLS